MADSVSFIHYELADHARETLLSDSDNFGHFVHSGVFIEKEIARFFANNKLKSENSCNPLAIIDLSRKVTEEG